MKQLLFTLWGSKMQSNLNCFVEYHEQYWKPCATYHKQYCCLHHYLHNFFIRRNSRCRSERKHFLAISCSMIMNAVKSYNHSNEFSITISFSCSTINDVTILLWKSISETLKKSTCVIQKVYTQNRFKFSFSFQNVIRR